MQKRENEKRSTGELKFSGKEVQLAAKMLEKITTPIDIIYSLMEETQQPALVVMLITAKQIDLYPLLDDQKRDTDILFEIDKEESVYILLCQNTKVDGGYRFAERLLKAIESQNGKEVYCAEIETKHTRYTPKELILKLMKIFSESIASERTNEIVYKSLH
jgi:hypothetical protein